MTIVEFLEARLAYDEQVCAATPGGAFKVVPLEGSTEAEAEAVHQYYHRFQPEWLARDLAAKRKVLEFWKIWSPPGGPVLRQDTWAVATRHAIMIVLYQMALPYADHPDYQQEWKP